MKERPEFLYKYCTASGGLSILRNATLRFRPPNEFNDPFDANPAVLLDDQEIERIVADVVGPNFAFAGILNSDPTPGDPVSFKKSLRAKVRDRREIAKDIIANTGHASLSSKFGICCLCENVESLCMWAYYGKEHTGCVIGFDMRHPFFAGNPGLRDVTYVPERPIHEYGGDGDWVYQKSDEWKHEREWRMLGQLSTLNRGGQDDDGHTLYLASFPPEAIASVYLGARMEASHVREFEELICRDGRRHIKILRATLDSRRFLLVFKPTIPAGS